jgi:RNA polymerase sigma-70 factor (ECF subfamily)
MSDRMATSTTTLDAFTGDGSLESPFAREGGHRDGGPPPSQRDAVRERLDFAAVYDAHFSYVWRSARRLGVHPDSIDDVVQDVFVVVHRRLADFEGRSSLKTWMFGIVLRVVRDHRRSIRRKRLGADARSDSELDMLPDANATPFERLEQVEAARLVDTLLDRLDDEKREVFVLAELEGMTVPEIAEITSANVNTVYSRLRAARKEFEAAVQRMKARMSHERAPAALDGKTGKAEKTESKVSTTGAAGAAAARKGGAS